MYIVIFDKKIILGEKTANTGCYYSMYENFLESYGDREFTHADIDEILIYSSRKDDAKINAKVAKCNSISIGEFGITFYISELVDIESTCDEVRKKIYGYAKRKNVLNENNGMNLCYIIDDENDYSYIKGEKKQSLYFSKRLEIEHYKQNNDWDGIIKVFGERKDLPYTEYWDSYILLSNLCFALGKKISKQKAYHNDLDDYFNMIVKRCLELDSENSMIKSTQAYYFYDKYIHFKKENDFVVANELYLSLINNSTEWYKEFYRYTNLRETNLENTSFSMDLKEKNSKYLDVKKDYKNLIDSFGGLIDDQKKRYKRLYEKSLYSYCAIEIDILMDYWKMYFDNQIFNKPYWTFMLENKKLEDINQVENYLNDFIKEAELGLATIDNIQNNPGYFHAYYRLAQIKQIKGIVCVMKNKNEKAKPFFEESNGLIEKSFKVANEYRENPKNKFNYPNYMRTVRAINYHFLGDFEKTHYSYGNKIKPYQMFEKAQLYLLENKVEEAIKILNEIPQNDNCYNKGIRLLNCIYEKR